jgi:hypothetical protein
VEQIVAPMAVEPYMNGVVDGIPVLASAPGAIEAEVASNVRQWYMVILKPKLINIFTAKSP